MGTSDYDGVTIASSPKVQPLFFMDDLELLQAFVSSYLSGRSTLLSNSDLRVEPISDTLQLLAKTEGLVATAKLSGDRRFTSIRYKSSFWAQLHEAMIGQKCLPIRKSKISGFYEYEPIEVPENYRVHFTDSLDLLQTWWSYKKNDRVQSLMQLLILHRDTWYPISNLICEQGTLTIQTSGQEMQMYPLDMLVWLQKIEQPALPTTPKPIPQPLENRVQITPPAAQPEDHQVQPTPSKPQPSQAEEYLAMHRQAAASHYPDSKRIGSYLMDAGLLSPAQIDVVLSDQELTGMRFGEILVSRGWLKSQTIEFLFQHVILPQRTLAKKAVETAKRKVVNRLQETTACQSLPQPSIQPQPRKQQSIPIAELSETPPPSPQPEPQSSPPVSLPQPEPEVPTAPRILSIHDRETLATHNKLNLEDLPDWLEMDPPD